MAYLQMAAAAIILGFFYVRMIRRETPQHIGKPLAILPVVLGVVSLPVSFACVVALAKTGYASRITSPVLLSFAAAFFGAGFAEELAKLLMMLLTVRIFRKQIRNVYEYMLIGSAVAIGFTVAEEYLYGESLTTLVARIATVAAHVSIDVIMAKHLALARYKKENDAGSVAAEYVKAILIPVLIHTLYDACTSDNQFIISKDEKTMYMGVAFSCVAYAAMFAYQIIVLAAFKKHTKTYCAMTFAPLNKQGSAEPIVEPAHPEA